MFIYVGLPQGVVKTKFQGCSLATDLVALSSQRRHLPLVVGPLCWRLVAKRTFHCVNGRMAHIACSPLFYLTSPATAPPCPSDRENRHFRRACPCGTPDR